MGLKFDLCLLKFYQDIYFMLTYTFYKICRTKTFFDIERVQKIFYIFIANKIYVVIKIS